MSKDSEGVREKISVVIPTYRRGDLLEKCIESIRTQVDSDVEIILVDDSGDPTYGGALAAICPEARILHHETNRGFAVAANAGIRAANNPWIMLLNDDMVLATNCLTELASVMRHGNLAGVGPLILDADGEQIYAAGDRLLQNGRPESIGFRQPRAGFVCDETPFGITAGAALYTRSFLEEVGGFDERFIAYFEDADLATRARLEGRFFALQESAIAYHVGSASIEGRTWWRTRQCMRNHILLVKTNYPFSTALKFWPAIMREALAHMSRTFSAVRCDRGAVAGIYEVLRVYGELFVLAPHIIRKRYTVQRRRTISAHEFEALLSKIER